MTIGHIWRKVIAEATQTAPRKTALILDIAAPLLGRTSLTVSANNEKTNANEPDYLLWYNPNPRGSSRYKSVRVGALWNKSSSSGRDYKSGHIELPAVQGGKLYIAVFTAQQKDGQPPLQYTHDVVWSPPQQRTETDQYAVPAEMTHTQANGPQVVYEKVQTHAPAQTPQPQIDIDEEEIPF